MELKQKKPIHLRCPKCGYDFAYNTNHIEREIDELKEDIAQLLSEIQFYKRNHRNYKKEYEFKNLQCTLRRKQERLSYIKKARKATAVEIKLQTNIIFRQLVERRIGKEETLKLLKEAEEEMIYYDWDMATQTFTRFEGI